MQVSTVNNICSAWSHSAGGYAAYAVANVSNDRSFYFELCPGMTVSQQLASIFLRLSIFASFWSQLCREAVIFLSSPPGAAT